MATSRKKPAALTARNADRHALYEIATQRPEVMLGFIDELFEYCRTRPAKLLREDFCGTAFLASTWARSDPDRRAGGVDIDADVLEWAERHNRRSLGEAASRLALEWDDVLRVEGARADVLVSLNFSHFIYKRRDELLRYFRHAHDRLEDDGLMIVDAFGGPESIRPSTDARSFSDFTYLWEQASFNPLTNEIVCHIHFKFPNGSTMRQAFTYDWRMWSIPELRKLLQEAGFTETAVYFESEDGLIGDMDAVNLEAWVAYIAALR